jgi:hypothetical protein
MQDKFDLLLKRLDARFEKGLQKIRLIQEGLDDESLLKNVWGHSMRHLIRVRIGAEGKSGVPHYHQPHTRPYRPTTADGRTSFHFRYDRVNKMPAQKRHGKASARRSTVQARTLPYIHGRYIEREDGVAKIAAVQVTQAEARIDKEAANERNAIWDHADAAAAIFGRPVLQSNIGDPGETGRTTGDGRSFAVQVMSLLHMDSATTGSEREMHGHVGHHPAFRAADPELRRLASDTGSAFGPPINPLPSDPQTVEQDRYIDRAAAVAIQPDGSRALITNIDADDRARESFWRQVEEHERQSKPDKMSVCFAANADFWADVVRDPACPLSLRKSYAEADHDKSVKFEIESAPAMRAFLATHPDWIANERKPKGSGDAEWVDRPISQARFHDGRDGRTQYRLVGELPKELGAQQCVELLRDVCRDFEKRKLPFVAVVHAPDAHNHDANWHFHLIFYDRPCRKITKADISQLRHDGHDVSKVEPGAWDFALRFPVPGRKDRWNYPLRRNKDRRVIRDDYIETLRSKVATITNTHLEAAGVTRRVDPGTYADMGLEIEPQEHLGAKSAVTEGKGRPTAAGTRNEEKQDRFFQNEIEKRRVTDRATAAAQVLALRATSRNGQYRSGLREIASALGEAINWEYQAAQMKRLLERSQSRADHVLRVNRKLVHTAGHDKGLLSAKELAQRQTLLSSSLDYIEHLDFAFAAEWNFIKDAEANAKACRLKARQAENALSAPIIINPGQIISEKITLSPVAGLVVTPVISHSTDRSFEAVPTPLVIADGTYQSAANVDGHSSPKEAALPVRADTRFARSSMSWIEMIERDRPLILVREKKLHVPGAGEDHQKQPDIQARLVGLYQRQQDEIELLVQHITHNSGVLIRQHRSAPDGAEQYVVKGTTTNLAQAFRRYQTAEKLAMAIIRYEERLSAPAAAQSEPTAFRPNEQDAGEALTMSGPTTPVNKPSLSQMPLPAAAKPVEQPRCLVEPMPIQPLAPAAERSFDIEAFRQRVKRGEVPLALDDKGAVRDECFIRAGVPPHSLPLVAADHRYVAEAGAQIDKAIKKIRDHLADLPDHLHRADKLSLAPEAPVYLRALWDFHAPSRLFRDRIVAAVARMTDFEVEPTAQIGAPTDASANRPVARSAQPAQADGPLPYPKQQTASGSKDAQKAALVRALQNGFGPTR